MKSFGNACKKRPLFLWIGLLITFAVGTFMFGLGIGSGEPLVGASFYLFSVMPAFQVAVYVKPLNRYEVAQIVCEYLCVIMHACILIWAEIAAVFLLADFVFLLIMILCFVLEWIHDKKQKAD